MSAHTNVTLASAVVASCIDFAGARNKIVCSSLNFPSIIYLYRQQERRGAQLELVDSPDGPVLVSTRGNKEIVGETAARIRRVRPPEPYKGKGIRYVGEYVIRKAGKAAK